MIDIHLSTRHRLLGSDDPLRELSEQLEDLSQEDRDWKLQKIVCRKNGQTDTLSSFRRKRQGTLILYNFRVIALETKTMKIDYRGSLIKLSVGLFSSRVTQFRHQSTYIKRNDFETLVFFCDICHTFFCFFEGFPN